MTTSHVAGCASEIPTPAQHKEFWTQVGKGKITKERMQQLLRGQMENPKPPAKDETPWEGDLILTKIEELCQQNFPDHVDNVLEIVRPFCSKDLSFDLKPPFDEAVCWERANQMYFHPDWLAKCRGRAISINHKAPYFLHETSVEDGHNAMQKRGDGFSTLLSRCYNDVLNTLVHVHPYLSEFRTKVTGVPGGCATNLQGLIWKKVCQSYACKFGLVDWLVAHSFGYTCGLAIEIAASFAAVGDSRRVEEINLLLKLLKSGNWPIQENAETRDIDVLCLIPK